MYVHKSIKGIQCDVCIALYEAFMHQQYCNPAVFLMFIGVHVYVRVKSICSNNYCNRVSIKGIQCHVCT